VSGLLLVADPHFGLTTHDGPDLDGSPSWRQNEARRIADFVRETAEEREATVIGLGDLFHSVRPQAWAYQAAARMGLDYNIPGNHDWPVGEGVLSPLFSGALRNVWQPTHPDTDRIDDLDVAFIPWFSRAFVAATYPDLLVGDQNRYMAQALERIVADLAGRKRPGIPLIVVTHFTIGGATYVNDVQPQIGESSDFMVPASVFADDRIDAVFAGHIHKPQTFGKVTYIGSPVRSDFGERDQQTRVLHVTNQGGCVVCEIIETPSVEFVDVDLDTAISPTHVAGKVVRIVGDAPAGEATAAQIAMLTDNAYSLGALHVSKPAVKFTRHEARAVRLIEVDAKPEDALTSFAEMVGGEYAANLPALLEVQDELLRKAIA
jgi:DNA repair exonuclease SbcCD nuclease subunit